MAFLITPTTELEAVNECLENIGQSPVSTISGTLGVDTNIALGYVRRLNRQMQSKGWYWNTEKDYPLTPDGSGDILLPSNTLAVDTTGSNKTDDYVQRGQRLYNKDDHTYTFTKDVYVELVVGLPFEEMPETARRYVALKAARMFQNRIEGFEDRGDTEEEIAAYTDLMSDQIRAEDNNMLTDNWDTASTLVRTAF